MARTGIVVIVIVLLLVGLFVHYGSGPGGVSPISHERVGSELRVSCPDPRQKRWVVGSKREWRVTSGEWRGNADRRPPEWRVARGERNANATPPGVTSGEVSFDNAFALIERYSSRLMQN